MKKVVRREFLRIAAAAALVCAAASLTGCGQNVEKLVVGDWYLEGSDRLRFTIYDDGTVNIPGTYGTGIGMPSCFSTSSACCLTLGLTRTFSIIVFSMVITSKLL